MLLAMCLYGTGASATSPAYTAVTATLQDTSGQVWAGAQYTVNFVPPFGNPAQPNNNGHPITPNQTGLANGSGQFTVQVDDNSVVAPAGSAWQFIICPNSTTSNCLVANIPVSGTSQNISTLLNPGLPIPNVNAQPTLYRAYGDQYAFGGYGATYINLTTGFMEICQSTMCNGSGWVVVGAGAGANCGTPLIKCAEQFDGATADVKITNAMAALLPAGGIVDARGFGCTNQTIAHQLLIGSSTQQVTLLVERCTRYNITITSDIDAIQIYSESAILGDEGSNPLNPEAGFVAGSGSHLTHILTCTPNNLQKICNFSHVTFRMEDNTATVDESLVYLQGVSDITSLKDDLIWNFYNTVGLKIASANGQAVGPIDFQNLTVNGSGNTGAKPIQIYIGGTSNNGISNVNFFGGTMVHPGPGGLKILDIDGKGVGGALAGVNLYGTYIEPLNAADIGISIRDAVNTHFSGIFSAGVAATSLFQLSQSGAGLTNGTTITSARHNGNWTHTINNTITSVNVDDPQITGWNDTGTVYTSNLNITSMLGTSGCVTQVNGLFGTTGVACGGGGGGNVNAYNSGGTAVPSHVVSGTLTSPTTDGCCNGPLYIYTLSGSAQFSGTPVWSFNPNGFDTVPWRTFTAGSPIASLKFFNGTNQVSGITSIAYDGSVDATVVFNNSGPIYYGLLTHTSAVYLQGMTAATFLNNQPATVASIDYSAHSAILVYGISGSVVGTTATTGSVNVNGAVNATFSCVGPN